MKEIIKILEDNNIEYIIQKKKRKTIRFHYDQLNILVISVPHQATFSSITNVVENNISWIVKHKTNKPLPTAEINDGMKYIILGKEYEIRTISNKHEDVQMVNGIIYIYFDKTPLYNLLKKYCLKIANEVFSNITLDAYKKIIELNVQYPKILIKESKRNWGYCKIKKGEIMLNLALIHVPTELIKYVAYHELCHFIFPNHSKDFHRLLTKYISQEKECRKKLLGYSIFF